MPPLPAGRARHPGRKREVSANPATAPRWSGSRAARGPVGCARCVVADSHQPGAPAARPAATAATGDADPPGARLQAEVASHEHLVHARVDVLGTWSGRGFREQDDHTTESKTCDDDCHGRERGPSREPAQERRVLLHPTSGTSRARRRAGAPRRLAPGRGVRCQEHGTLCPTRPRTRGVMTSTQSGLVAAAFPTKADAEAAVTEPGRAGPRAARRPTPGGSIRRWSRGWACGRARWPRLAETAGRAQSLRGGSLRCPSAAPEELQLAEWIPTTGTAIQTVDPSRSEQGAVHGLRPRAGRRRMAPPGRGRGRSAGEPTGAR